MKFIPGVNIIYTKPALHLFGSKQSQSGQSGPRQKNRYSPKRRRLPIQEGRSGKAKGYQVEQFLVQYEESRNEKV